MLNHFFRNCFAFAIPFKISKDNIISEQIIIFDYNQTPNVVRIN